MDSGFFSHVVIWVVGGLATIGGIAAVGALFSLGRNASYKKH
ncbi:hypothetical protein SAMN04487848_3108 [Microbacterium sp. ru370.1]|nr:MULTISPECIES: hypothetical protein [unclassified Microbacterium]SDP03631.1 hypothetical protein SAMN04487848_3108 [Microbacterium sp. ru370.1]SIT91611.1 hypothetical protein SAMN05880579_2471 [Microbacterium sp. RU1D]